MAKVQAVVAVTMMRRKPASDDRPLSQWLRQERQARQDQSKRSSSLGVNGCHSICGDMADGIICGPHACTPEAAGSCCPSDDDDEEREEEAAD